MKKREKMWSRMLRFFGACAILVMLFGITSMAAGTKVVDMKKASNGVYQYNGVLEDRNTTVYHRLVVNKSGVLQIAGASISEYSGSRWGLNVILCNSNKKSLESGSYGQYVSTDNIAFYGVKRGVYYIKVSGEKLYTLAASFSPMADKGGASKKKATTIKHKKTITGVMPAGEKAKKADWFKIKVTKKKKLCFTINNMGNGTFDFYIYGPKLPKGGSRGSVSAANKGTFYIVNGFTRKPIKVSKGTYYIKVVRSSYSKKASGGYSIQWKMK